MKAVTLLLIIPLTYLVLAVPTYALSVVTNTSTNVNNLKFISCVNQSDNKIWCYSTRTDGSNAWLFKMNETGGNLSNCSLGVIYIPFGLTVMNETHAKLSTNNKCHTINITDFTSCAVLWSNNTGSGSSDCAKYGDGQCGDWYETEALAYYGLNGIVNFSGNILASPYWSSSIAVTFPNRSDNSTLWATSITGSVSSFYVTGFKKYVESVYSYTLDNFSTLWNISDYNTMMVLYKKDAVTTMGYIIQEATPSYFYAVNFSEADNSSYQSCEVSDSRTYCDLSDSEHRQYLTNSSCGVTYDQCPVGTVCSQLTPQMNVSSGLVENYTSCQIITNYGWRINCWNICFWGTVIWSNCVEEGCKVCPDHQGGFSYGGTYGYYTDTWYSNQSTVSVPSYTIACINVSTGYAETIIDELGNETNETALLTRAGNNITEISPSGEIPTPEDEGTIGLRKWLNAGMGSTYGSDIISLIVAGVISIMVFINVNRHDKNPALLFGSFFFVASVFSFVGLLTVWFLVLEVTLIGVLIFWKAKGD